MRFGRENTAGRERLIISVIIVAAAVIRIIYIIQLHSSDLEWILPLDMHFYRELAAEISRGGMPLSGGLTFNPLYPVFLAAVFRLAGSSLLVPRIIQSILGVLTVCLIYIAGKEVAVSGNRSRAGIAAAALALFYPQFLLYEGSFLATSLVTLLLTASFLTALRLDRDIKGGRPASGNFLRRGALLGVILGAGSLGRPNLFLLLIPAAAVWFFFRNGSGKRARLASAGALLGAAAVLLVPAIYNGARTGRFVPVTSHGGINLYIGNRIEGGGVYKPPPGMRMDMRGLVEDARNRASELTGREMTDQEASGYWISRALDNISERPGGAAKLLLRKFALFWNRAEIPDVIDISLYREECPVMKILFIPFSLISALALAGLIAVYITGRNRGVFTLYIGAAVVSVIIFFVNSRYRIPSVPVMILSGAVFIDMVTDRMERKRWKEGIITLCALPVIFFGFVNRNMIEVNRSAMYTFMGNEYMERGMEEKGREMFERAYRMDPGSAETRINYARVLVRRGDPAAAAELYGSVFSSFPDFPRLAIEYGAALLETGRVERAQQLFRWAYRNRPTAEKVMACRYLSRIAFAEGDRDQAASWIRRALELVPGNRELEEILNRLETP
ncbi:MAG: glycosyltransferase family 39 protein [Candidatus Krumholzibacteriales bacterium]